MCVRSHLLPPYLVQRRQRQRRREHRDERLFSWTPLAFFSFFFSYSFSPPLPHWPLEPVVCRHTPLRPHRCPTRGACVRETTPNEARPARSPSRPRLASPRPSFSTSLERRLLHNDRARHGRRRRAAAKTREHDFTQRRRTRPQALVHIAVAATAAAATA